MAGEENQKNEFPDSDTPVIFADGVLAFTHSSEIAKFYLGRYDPSIKGSGQSTTVISAQVVMPLASFVSTVAFFDNLLDKMISQGVVKSEDLEVAKATLRASQK